MSDLSLLLFSSMCDVGCVNLVKSVCILFLCFIAITCHDTFMKCRWENSIGVFINHKKHEIFGADEIKVNIQSLIGMQNPILIQSEMWLGPILANFCLWSLFTCFSLYCILPYEVLLFWLHVYSLLIVPCEALCGFTCEKCYKSTFSSISDSMIRSGHPQ